MVGRRLEFLQRHAVHRVRQPHPVDGEVLASHFDTGCIQVDAVHAEPGRGARTPPARPAVEGDHQNPAAAPRVQAPRVPGAVIFFHQVDAEPRGLVAARAERLLGIDLDEQGPLGIGGRVPRRVDEEVAAGGDGAMGVAPVRHPVDPRFGSDLRPRQRAGGLRGQAEQQFVGQTPKIQARGKVRLDGHVGCRRVGDGGAQRAQPHHELAGRLLQFLRQRPADDPPRGFLRHD